VKKEYILQAAKSQEKYLKYKLMNIAYLKVCGERVVSWIEATQRLLHDHPLGRRGVDRTTLKPILG